MALYIPHSIFHLARLLYVRPETFGPYYVYIPICLTIIDVTTFNNRQKYFFHLFKVMWDSTGSSSFTFFTKITLLVGSRMLNILEYKDGPMQVCIVFVLTVCSKFLGFSLQMFPPVFS